MTYEEKEDSREVILVGYYNVLFYLIFRVGLDEYKKDILIERIRSGERMVMNCLLYTSPSPRDPKTSRMPSSA